MYVHTYLFSKINLYICEHPYVFSKINLCVSGVGILEFKNGIIFFLLKGIYKTDINLNNAQI